MSGFTVKRDSGLFIGDVDVAPASGTIQITENGEHNVAQYAVANVNVPQPSGKINITQNGTDIDVSEYALADVDVNTADVGYMMMIERRKSYGIQYSILPTNEYRVDDNINQIGNYAFAALDFCETIDLSNIIALRAIGDYAFFAGVQAGGAYRTSYLQSVIFPEDIPTAASIGEHAFEGCTNLTTLDLRGFYSIGSSCFANSGITTLYFSTNVNFVQEAFNDANSLTDIYYEGTQSEWEENPSLTLSGLSSSVTIHYDYVPSN